MSSCKETKKGGFFQRLFGRESSQNRRRNTSEEDDKKTDHHHHHHHHHHSPTNITTRLITHGPTAPSQTVKPPAKEAPSRAGVSSSGGVRRPAGTTAGKSRHGRSARSPSSSSSSKSSGSRRRSRRRKRRQPTDVKIDTAVPLVFPTTPEMVLAYHKARPFLDRTEEWVLMSLIEYECMLDGLEVVRTMANHSQFFEVEPEDLCEEFFEFVELVPSYDEVINDDIWQEFRYAKYNW